MNRIRIHIVGIVLAVVCLFRTAGAQDSLQAVPLFPGDTIRSMHPLLSPDGRYLYFTREQCKRNLGQANHADIWLSRQRDSVWMPPVHLSYPVNDFAADHPAGSGLNREWLVTFRRTGETAKLLNFQKKGRRWMSTWSALPELGDSTQHWFDWHLNHDQQLLVFCASPSADDPADIYLTRRHQNGTWSLPERLPAPINSPYHEATVFMAADERALYFSSDRPGGRGGQDLWYSRAGNIPYSTWTTPQNLGSGINSARHDQDIAVSVIGESCIFVRAQGDTSRLYQCGLPVFARPESVSLISIQLTGDPAVDSINLVVFPLERPPLQHIIPKTTRDEEQLVLPTDQTFAVYAETDTPLFSPSRIVAAGNRPAEPLDYSVYSDTTRLQESRVYQERSDIIRNLQNQLQHLDRDIAQLVEQQEDDIYQLYRLQFPPLPSGIFNRNDPEIRAMENRYEAVRRRQAEQQIPPFSRSEYDLFVTSLPLDTLSAKTAQERLDRLRRRFQLRQQEGYVSDDPLHPAALDSLENQMQQLPDFATFRTDLVRRLQARLFAGVRDDVVERAIPVAIQRVREQLGDNELFILSRDEEQLPGILRDLEVSVQPVDTSGLRPLADWQRPFANQLRNRLRATLRPLMRSALTGKVRRYLVNALTYYIKQERKIVLQESLAQQIAEQTIEESRLGVWDARLIPPATSPSVSPPQPEVRLALPLDYARSHNPVELEALLFRPNQATFLAAAIPDLQRIIGFLQRYPRRKVHIAVHTHQNLTHTQAQQLTRQRTQQIRQYLERAGIPSDRIRTGAMGCSRPVTQGTAPEDLARNQRVEVYFFTEGDAERMRSGKGER